MKGLIIVGLLALSFTLGTAIPISRAGRGGIQCRSILDGKRFQKSMKHQTDFTKEYAYDWLRWLSDQVIGQGGDEPNPEASIYDDPAGWRTARGLN